MIPGKPIEKQEACPNCGSYINPEIIDDEDDRGAILTKDAFECKICHHKLATIVWCLMPAKYMELMTR